MTMKFGLAISSDLNKGDIIVNLSSEMENHFKHKDYGSGIMMYTIGVLCVSPQFDQFFPLGKPKYVKGKKNVKLHGVSLSIENAFSCEIKLDFEKLHNGSEFEVRKILAFAIVKSLSVLDGFKTKISDFDFDRFKDDMVQYFDKELRQ